MILLETVGLMCLDQKQFWGGVTHNQFVFSTCKASGVVLYLFHPYGRCGGQRHPKKNKNKVVICTIGDVIPEGAGARCATPKIGTKWAYDLSKSRPTLKKYWVKLKIFSSKSNSFFQKLILFSRFLNSQLK